MELSKLFSPQQLERLDSIRKVLDGKLTLKDAAQLMGISYRHAKRLKKNIVEQGPRAMLHGNFGRKSDRALDEDIRSRILNHARNLYADLNDTQLAEKLVEEQDIKLSRESVRKILRREGIRHTTAGKRIRRMSPCVRNKREGTMVLWGGLTGRWFSEAHPECCFMAAVDMATLKCLAARFCPVETSMEYLWLLKKIISTYGIPVSFCQYSQKAIRCESSKWTLQEELQGHKNPGQVARVLEQMGIRHTHEKKRRFIRILNTLQDELLHEIARTNIACLAEGNLFLERQFILDFNHRHAYALTDIKHAWRKAPDAMEINRLCSQRYDAVVDSTNIVTVENMTIQIPPGPDRISYAMAPVTVHRFLNGAWCVYYNDKIIATHNEACFHELKEELHKHCLPHETGPVAAQWIYRMYTACTQLPKSDLDEVISRR